MKEIVQSRWENYRWYNSQAHVWWDDAAALVGYAVMIGVMMWAVRWIFGIESPLFFLLDGVAMIALGRQRARRKAAN